MTWQIPLSIGLLYLCVGILFFNSGIFNYPGYGHGAPTVMSTTTTTVSLWNLQPTKAFISDGYIPYKKISIPRADNTGERWTGGISMKRARQQGESDVAPDCPSGKKSCSNLGHPEICCYNEHTCLPTNNTVNGVYCCRSPDPIRLPCDEENLKCDPGWYECPASADGGCCRYGQRCGLVQCFEGGGPAAPATTITSSMANDDDMSSMERTTTLYMTVVNATMSSISSGVGTATRTSYTPIDNHIPTGTITTSADDMPTDTLRNGAPVTFSADSAIPLSSTAGRTSAAGARAKVGRHCSWMVVSWWMIAALLEGF